MSRTWRSWAWITGIVLLLLIAGGTALSIYLAPPPLPADVRGRLAFVSDAGGRPALFIKDLPNGSVRQLTYLTDDVSDAAFSPNGRRIAFSHEGHISVVDLPSGDVRALTLGVDWYDATPSWRPDGQALLVAARRARDLPPDIHLLVLDGDPKAPMGVLRRPLTDTPGIEEMEPIFDAAGKTVVYVREDNVFLHPLDGASPHRLTGGFRQCRSPHFLPGDAAIVFAWSEGKDYGIDRIDRDGKNRVTLYEGTTCYRTLAPSPDGHYLAATFAFDLAFHPSTALRPWQVEEIHLLDADAQPVAVMLASWRSSFSSPSWHE